MTRDVETYLQEGCGRCTLGGTPDCKVHLWTRELQALRRIVLSSGLTEESKWGVPTYTLNGKNVLLIAAFKDNCRISFFKGSLLRDDHKVLEKEGKNSQVGRMISFTSADQILETEPILLDLIQQAIEVEKAGLQPEKPVSREPIPEELQQRFEEMPELKAAFDNLTPGRQRGYILYISGAKQSATRLKRVDKYIPNILDGKGIHDC